MRVSKETEDLFKGYIKALLLLTNIEDIHIQSIKRVETEDGINTHVSGIIYLIKGDSMTIFTVLREPNGKKQLSN